jgi:hypothetical protein
MPAPYTYWLSVSPGLARDGNEHANPLLMRIRSMMRMLERASPSRRHAAIGAGSSTRNAPSCTRRPMSVASKLFPMADASMGVSGPTPGA